MGEGERGEDGESGGGEGDQSINQSIKNSY